MPTRSRERLWDQMKPDGKKRIMGGPARSIESIAQWKRRLFGVRSAEDGCVNGSRKPLGRGRLSMVRRRVNCVSALNWSWKTVAPEVFHQRCIKRLQDTRSSNMSNTRQWMKQVFLTYRKKMGALYRNRSLQKRLGNLELKVGFGLWKERCGCVY